MSKSRSVGTTLKIGVTQGSTETMTTIGALKSISGIDQSAETVDVTDLGNSSGYREFLGGFKDAGEVTASGYFDAADAGQTALLAAFGTGAATNFEIVFPSAIGKKWTFSGVVTKCTTGASVDDAVTFDLTIKVSGAATLAASNGTVVPG